MLGSAIQCHTIGTDGGDAVALGRLSAAAGIGSAMATSWAPMTRCTMVRAWTSADATGAEQGDPQGFHSTPFGEKNVVARSVN
jgi:hypothetical protein